MTIDHTQPERITDDAIASAQSQIKALLKYWTEASRLKDIDLLMSLYSPDITYFDVVPPLQHLGSDSIRRNFLRWFDGWESSINMEIRDLHIMAGEDIATAYMLIRTSGTLKNGHDVGYWVRATICCQWSNPQWLITHEHISLPVNPGSWTAALDLVP